MMMGQLVIHMGKRNELSLYPIPYIKILIPEEPVNPNEKSNVKTLGEKKRTGKSLNELRICKDFFKRI